MGALSPASVATIAWCLLSSVIYGYHISALNSPKAALSCTGLVREPRVSNFPPCIPLTLAQFGLVTSAYILGGLLSCALTSTGYTYLRPSQSLRKRFVLCAVIAFGGELLQAASTTYGMIALGRLVTGFGAAGGIGLVPPALGELAPASLKGSVGVLHQLGIVLGILSAQALGLGLSKPMAWRAIPFLSALVSLAQIVTAPCVSFHHRKDDGDDARAPIRARSESVSEEANLLPPDSPDLAAGDQPSAQLFAPEARKGTLIALASMILQQFSGINAVMFYSTTLLEPLFPAQAKYLAFYLTAWNVAMTFPPIYLVHKLGSRRLLLLSTAAMFASCVELGWAINTNRSWPAAAGVFLMVGSFAIGLGPVPFLLPSLLSPAPVVPRLSSLSLLLNFGANLAVGALFLPVRNALSSPAKGGRRRADEGNVFFVFAAALAVGGLALARWWRS